MWDTTRSVSIALEYNVNKNPLFLKNIFSATLYLIPFQCMTIFGSCTFLVLGGYPFNEHFFLLNFYNINREQKLTCRFLSFCHCNFSLFPPDVKSRNDSDSFIVIRCQVCYLFVCHFRRSWKCSKKRQKVPLVTYSNLLKVFLPYSCSYT